MTFLGTLCIILLIIGLVKPRLVIRWGEESSRNRKKVVQTYLGLALVLFILSSSMTKSEKQTIDTPTKMDTPIQKENSSTNVSQNQQQNSQEKNSTSVSNKHSGVVIPQSNNGIDTTNYFLPIDGGINQYTMFTDIHKTVYQYEGKQNIEGKSVYVRKHIIHSKTGEQLFDTEYNYYITQLSQANLGR